MCNFPLVLQLKKTVIMILISLEHSKGENYYQMFLGYFDLMTKSKQVMILQLGPYFEMHFQNPRKSLLV